MSHGSHAFFEVELSTTLGRIRGRVAIDTGPMRLAELVPTTYELTNILVDRAKRREERAGRQISCQPGCGACCSQMVPLSPPEAFYLADMIDSFDPDRRARALERFDEIVNKLKDRHMIDKLLEPEYSDEVTLPIAKEYFELQMPCPFLIDSSCAIHPDRPVACREYNVTSLSKWCADPYSREIVKVPMPLPLSAPLARLTARLTGSKPRLIPLTLVPVWVAEHADLRERQWPGVALFQQFMSIVGPEPGDDQRKRKKSGRP